MNAEKKKSRIIGISTGTVYKEGSKVGERLLKIKEGRYDVRGIEICFGTVEEFNEFIQEEKEHTEFIMSFHKRGIHAPVDLREYDVKTQKKILDEVHAFYKRIDASYIVFHPYVDFDINLVKGKDWTVFIENLLPLKNVPVETLKKIMDENPGFMIMLDTCHALTYSREYFTKFLSVFKDRIGGVHLSTDEGEEGHSPLCMSKGKTLELLEKLKELDCPWIIETWGTKYSDDLKKEVHFVKSFSRSI